MKKVAALLNMIGGASLLALVVGCATTMRTEDLLSAAGFKIMPATTPVLQARLKAIPAHKVTMVQRDGKEYFVYPDVTQERALRRPERPVPTISAAPRAEPSGPGAIERCRIECRLGCVGNVGRGGLVVTPLALRIVPNDGF